MSSSPFLTTSVYSRAAGSRSSVIRDVLFRVLVGQSRTGYSDCVSPGLRLEPQDAEQVQTCHSCLYSRLQGKAKSGNVLGVLQNHQWPSSLLHLLVSTPGSVLVV